MNYNMNEMNKNISNLYQIKDYSKDISSRMMYFRLELYSMRNFYHYILRLYSQSRSNRNWNLDEIFLDSFASIVTKQSLLPFQNSKEKTNPLIHYCNNRDKEEMLDILYKILEIFFNVNPLLVNSNGVMEILCFNFCNHFKYRIYNLVLEKGLDVNRNHIFVYDLEESNDIEYVSKILDLMIEKGVRFHAYLPFQLKSYANIKKLLDYCFIPDITNEDGNTPLHEIFLGSKNIDILPTVKLLLERGANPNFQNIDGDTPLHFYVKYNIFSLHPKFFKICDQLINHGANLNIVNRDGENILSILQKDHFDSQRIVDNVKKITKYLVKKGFNINTPKLGYDTSYPILKILLNCGMDPNLVDEYNETILNHLMNNLFENRLDHVINNNELINSIFLLRNYNYNWSRVDNRGNNILHNFFIEAHFEHHTILFLMLYDFGVKLNVKNKIGKTPLDYASSFDYYYLFDNAISTKNYGLLDELLGSINSDKLQEFLYYYEEGGREDTVAQKLREYISMRNGSSMAVLDRFICQDVMKYVVNKYCYPCP